MPASPGYSGVSSTSLNGLNTQNGIAQTFVINITSGMSVSSKINITGDAGDVFILRWDSDGNPSNGYQGTAKFQSGGAVVPLGGLKPSNFINVAGNINSSGGGSNPSTPFPQGPRLADGTGSLITNSSNFSGGGFFTGYWLTTGDNSGQTSSLSIIPLTPGTYQVKVKYYTPAPAIFICEKIEFINVYNALLGQQGDRFEFEAFKQEEFSSLYWIHNGGDRVERYVLERSSGDADFKTIGEQPSAGGQSPELYEGYDFEPLTGDNFYRIKLVYTDGSFSYSDVQQIYFPDLADFMVFPNPANDFAKINLESVEGSTDVTITIFNNLGLEMKRFQIKEVAGKYFQMDIRDLREGHYIVWLNVPGRRPIARTLMVGRI